MTGTQSLKQGTLLRRSVVSRLFEQQQQEGSRRECMTFQEQEAAGLPKRHEARGQEALQEQAAIGTRLSLSAKSTTLNI